MNLQFEIVISTNKTLHDYENHFHEVLDVMILYDFGSFAEVNQSEIMIDVVVLINTVT